MTTPEQQWERIGDIMHDIPLREATLLTGRNGSGKSLLRSQINFRVKEELGEKVRVVHASMALRTGSFPGMGALSGMTRDLDWLPTSLCTIRCIEKLPAEGNYVVIDEPEIGCGEETVVALTSWLKEWLSQCGALGSMVITHNRHTATHLDHDAFFNLDGYKTLQEWLDREIVPTDLDALRDNDLGRYLRDRQKAAREEKKGK